LFIGVEISPEDAMKVLNPRTHGVLDYLTVAAFLSAPALLGLTGTPALIAYSLAGIHLVLTLLTAFPLGVVKLVPMALHGALELAVSVGLVALPWILGFADHPTPRWFYIGAGAVIFAVWLITDNRGVRKPAP
jgi:hypothetical protein